MRLQAFALAAAWSALPATAAAFPVTDLQRAGPAAQRFNVAILGDGYRVGDQTKLTNDARALVDALFSIAPYKPYRQLFNFKIIHTVSLDQGAKGGSAGGAPNTLFGAYFNCEGVSQLICMNDGDVLAAAAADMPEFNLALVVVNDSKYGGAGGSVPCVSTDEGAAEMLRHELGHTLANLADEYTDPYPSYPACSPSQDCTEPNATLRRVRSEIKWLDWITDSTAVPTSVGHDFTGVGLFEGARYLTEGVYRPVDTACKMQSLNQAFCPVCSEALVRSFWNLENVSLIDRALPASEASETTCVEATFAIETPTITPSTLTFAWTVDGEPVASSGKSLAIAAGQLSEGAHEVVVTVSDPTPLVRSDPQGSLRESHAFTFHAPACPRLLQPGSAGSAGNGATGADSGGAAAGNGTGAGSDGGTSAAGAGSAAAGTGNAGATPSMKPPPPEDRVGCGCRIVAPAEPQLALLWLPLAGLLASWRRRAGPRQRRSAQP